jgi:hypothetical protein
MNKTKLAVEIYNSHYASIMEYGEDFGQEILISVLAIKASVITVDQKIETAKEVSGYVESKIYINLMEEVKQKILEL